MLLDQEQVVALMLALTNRIQHLTPIADIPAFAQQKAEAEKLLEVLKHARYVTVTNYSE